MNCLKYLAVLILLFFSVPAIAFQATTPESVGPAPEHENREQQPRTVTYRLKNLDAAAGENLLRDLFSVPKGGSDKSFNAGQLPSLTFTSYKAENSIVANGAKGDLEVVGDVLMRLDKVTIKSKSKVRVYRLSNSPALDVAKAIGDWFEARQQMLYGDQADANPVPVRITPEVVSNSLIVSGDPVDPQTKLVESMIRALDARPTAIHVDVTVRQSVDGKNSVIAQPKVITYDGQTAIVQIGDGIKGMTIEITPKVVEPAGVKKRSNQKK